MNPLDLKYLAKITGLTEKKILQVLNLLKLNDLAEVSITPSNKDNYSYLSFKLKLPEMKAKPINNSLLTDFLTVSVDTGSVAVDEKQEYIQFLLDLKRNYPVSTVNRYFKHFTAGNKRQFFSSLATRLAQGKMTLDSIEQAFQKSAENENYSLVDLLKVQLSVRYSVQDLLLDFLWIQVEGKVAGAASEMKAAKMLARWVAEDISSLEEIEDCWLYMLNGQVKYSMSLTAVPKALQNFSKLRYELPDGRHGFKLDTGRKSVYSNVLDRINNL